MTYAVEQTDETTVVRLYGDLCMATVPGVQATVDGLGYRLLVLDLADVKLIDSSGIGFLVQLRNECEARLAHLRLVNVSEGARRVLAIVGLSEFFDIH